MAKNLTACGKILNIGFNAVAMGGGGQKGAVSPPPLTSAYAQNFAQNLLPQKFVKTLKEKKKAAKLNYALKVLLKYFAVQTFAGV